MIRAVFLDVGETLVDETRQWGVWADALGVPRLTFFAYLGALIAADEPPRRVLDRFAPGFDPKSMRGRYAIELGDLYPDALPALAALKAAGLVVGIAGNQPKGADEALRACGIVADHVATSAGWGVAKPSTAFFARIVEAAGVPAAEIAYVGDRLDNDVLPARAVGMLAVLIDRGPWGALHARRPEAAQAHAVIRSLEELPGVLL